jgi:hypothetical protein
MISDIAAHRLTFTPLPLQPGCVYLTRVVMQKKVRTNEYLQFYSLLTHLCQ